MKKFGWMIMPLFYLGLAFVTFVAIDAVVTYGGRPKPAPGMVPERLPLPQPPGETPEPPLAVEVKCDECGGTGKVDGRPCMLCPGTGKLIDSKGVEHVCVMCAGTGKRFGECPMCGGSGTLYTNGRRPPPKLSPDDERLWQRFQDRIDARVDKRLVNGVEEAARDGKSGIGSALALALGKLVVKVVKAVIAGLVLEAVVVLLWHYWFVVAAFFGAVTSVASVAGWLGGKKATK